MPLEFSIVRVLGVQPGSWKCFFLELGLRVSSGCADPSLWSEYVHPPPRPPMHMLILSRKGDGMRRWGVSGGGGRLGHEGGAFADGVSVTWCVPARDYISQPAARGARLRAAASDGELTGGAAAAANARRAIGSRQRQRQLGDSKSERGPRAGPGRAGLQPWRTKG